MKKSPVCFQTFIFWLFLSLCIPFSASAQQAGEQSYKDVSAMPDGVVGERIQAVIDAVNANKAEAVASFIKKNCTVEFQDMAPMEVHANVFLSIFQSTGGIHFHSIRAYVPEREETVVSPLPIKSPCTIC